MPNYSSSDLSSDGENEKNQTIHNTFFNKMINESNPEKKLKNKVCSRYNKYNKYPVSIYDNTRCSNDDHHGIHRIVDWLALGFFAFLFFLIFTDPAFDRSWCKYISHPGYRWLAKGLLFFVIILVLDRAIENWRMDTFIE